MTDETRGEREAGTYSRLDFQAMAAAGDIEIIEPGTAEAAAFDREMTDELDAHNAEPLDRDGPDAMTSVRLLRQAGLLAERDPSTVSAALASYRERHGLDRAGMAARLGINATQMAALGLCEWPDPASPLFGATLADLARRYGADPERLGEVLA